jgi:Ala-tRNA(Pro) deacylase
MAVLPANSRLDLEKFEEAVGKPVALETETEFKTLFPDCAPGTMPPFGNLYGLTTYVDRALSKEDFIVFEAGTHTDAIKLKYKDYERAANPRIEDIAVQPRTVKRAE